MNVAHGCHGNAPHRQPRGSRYLDVLGGYRRVGRFAAMMEPRSPGVNLTGEDRPLREELAVAERRPDEGGVGEGTSSASSAHAVETVSNWIDWYREPTPEISIQPASGPAGASFVVSVEGHAGEPHRYTFSAAR